MIDDDRDAFRSKGGFQKRHERVDEASFVDEVRAEHEGKTEVFGRMAPIDFACREVGEAVEPGVVGGEFQGTRIVVSERHPHAQR
ncbi:MAG: hypothetical protein U0744_19225 [Gemmataceae bacterium]